MNIFERFWNWYEPKIVTALIPSTIILYLQIPHTITAAECFFGGSNFLFGVNPVSDFFLYGIDLLEAIPIMGNTITLWVMLRKKWRDDKRKQNELFDDYTKYCSSCSDEYSKENPMCYQTKDDRKPKCVGCCPCNAYI